MKLENVRNIHLWALMTAKGFTPARLAKASDVSLATLSIALRGEHDLTAYTARKLAATLNVDVWDIYHDRPIKEVYG